jgi:arsenate reductase (thioredoxin)
MINKKSVLFLCTHNSCRSQIAEGLLRSLYPDNYDVYSAGVVKTSVQPLAIKVMDEIDIDISNQSSKSIEVYKDRQFDYVVTVCDNAREVCPFFPGKNIIHKNFNDPSQIEGTDKEKMQAYRKIRDEIREWIKQTF